MAKLAQGSLAFKVADALKERILSWKYSPGQRLIEEEICEEFKVSRSPAREALARLAAYGLLDYAPRRGYTVKRLNMRSITELYQVRLALEAYVAESLALQGLGGEKLKSMRASWILLMDDPDAPYAELDRGFHESLAEILGNQVLLGQLSDINERLTIFRQFDFSAPERYLSTCKQHIEILDSILSREPIAARKAMAANIAEGLANVESAIKDLASRSYF